MTYDSASPSPDTRTLEARKPETQDMEARKLELHTSGVWMRLALEQARHAELAGEVPVGAVIVHDGRLLAHGQNRVIRDSDPTAHAEVVALRMAGQVMGNYRLEACDLYTTLEPCAMCAGAILHARLRRLIYAAADPKAGACGSALEVMNHPRLNHRVDVLPGILAEECGELLSTFFRLRRVKRQGGTERQKSTKLS